MDLPTAYIKHQKHRNQGRDEIVPFFQIRNEKYEPVTNLSRQRNMDKTKLHYSGNNGMYDSQQEKGKIIINKSVSNSREFVENSY